MSEQKGRINPGVKVTQSIIDIINTLSEQSGSTKGIIVENLLISAILDFNVSCDKREEGSMDLLKNHLQSSKVITSIRQRIYHLVTNYQNQWNNFVKYHTELFTDEHIEEIEEYGIEDTKDIYIEHIEDAYNEEVLKIINEELQKLYVSGIDYLKLAFYEIYEDIVDYATALYRSQFESISPGVLQIINGAMKIDGISANYSNLTPIYIFDHDAVQSIHEAIEEGDFDSGQAYYILNRLDLAYEKAFGLQMTLDYARISDFITEFTLKVNDNEFKIFTKLFRSIFNKLNRC